VGSQITAYTSANGSTWRVVNTITLSSLTSTLYAGLAVTSSSSSQLGTATFDNVSITGSIANVVPTATLSTTSAVETGPFTVQTVFSQSVSGLTANDFLVTNGSITSLTGSGNAYQSLVTPAEPGVVSVSLPANAAVNGSNTGNSASNTVSVTYSTQAVISITARDVGPVAAAGSTSLASGIYTVRGSGGEIFFASDGFHFASMSLTGDGEIRARVTSQTNTGDWAKAGVMIRENLTPGSRHAVVFTTPAAGGNGTGIVWRSTADANAIFQYGPPLNPAPNNWLRIVRAGNVITAYTSANGSAWTEVRSTTFASLSASLHFGLAVTATSSILSTATFDNVSITGSSGAASTQAEVASRQIIGTERIGIPP
jgi:regulation of enolase protein 1 (concanavalin A-like superfamily)